MDILRPHAENTYASELVALAAADPHPRPRNWKLSPWAVVTYLMGGKLDNGEEISPKYFGQRRLIEVAVATLATDRALLLMGVPGTAGMSEDALRYGWNYARLLAEGPSDRALVASPVMHGMQHGAIVRIEELTRIPSDVQDALITILSEKTLPIPELNTEVQAMRGFNIIATANDRDKGVNELSSALQRRFNTVVLPLPSSLEEEVEIVQTRVSQLGKALDLAEAKVPSEEIRRLVTIFRELRSGRTEDGKLKLKSPTATLSTAEVISVLNSGQALSLHFGDGHLRARDLAASLTGAIIKDTALDTEVWQEYLETVVKSRENWQDLYRACKEA